MPRTLSRNILGILRAIGVDAAGKGALVSDDIQLTAAITDYIAPALAPHIGGRVGGVLVPAGEIVVMRIHAPPDRPVHIIRLQATTANLQEVTISPLDVGGPYVPVPNPTSTWNGTPLMILEAGGVAPAAKVPSCFIMNRPSGTPGEDMVFPQVLTIPPDNFFYLQSQSVNVTVAIGMIACEPIPTHRTLALPSGAVT